MSTGRLDGMSAPAIRRTPRHAGWRLFVGDESALPAFAALIESLPPEQAAIALIEVESAADEIAVGRPGGELTLHWLHRNGVPPGSPLLLADALDALPPRPG